MCRRRSDISARLTLALLALASLTLSGTSLADRPFLDRFDTVKQIASTVPAKTPSWSLELCVSTRPGEPAGGLAPPNVGSGPWAPSHPMPG